MELQALNSAVLVTIGSNRKLLEGERVEVRQKEVGLRGSWHSGVVVQSKHCRRVVEYDELLTPDQSKKLRERIPFAGDHKSELYVDGKLPCLRERNEDFGGANSRPERNDGSNKGGFIRPVPPTCNTLSSDCWKKGLLVDAYYDYAWWEGVLLQDAFPRNENGMARILFPEEGDEMQIMQKDIRVSQDWDDYSGEWAVSGFWSFGIENGDIDFTPLRHICLQKRGLLKFLWRHRNFNGLQEQWKMVAHVSFSTPLMLKNTSQRNVVDKELLDCRTSDNNTVQQSHIARLSTGMLMAVDACLPSNPNSLSVAHEKEAVNATLSPGAVHGDGEACRSRRRKKVSEPAQHIDTGILHINDQDYHRAMEAEKNLDHGSDVSLNHDHQRDVDLCESAMGASKEFLLEHSALLKKLIRQARPSAKKSLLDAGWKVLECTRAQEKDPLQSSKKETVYISPEGRRYFTLAAACRGWKKCQSKGSWVGKDMDKGLKLLNSYILDMDVIDHHKIQADLCNAEQRVDPESVLDIPMVTWNSMPEQNGSIAETGIVNFEIVEAKKRRLSTCAQNRKRSDGQVGALHIEPRHKKGRPSGRRKSQSGQGGCRMQVLLGGGRDSSHAHVEPAHLKRSTVLSLLIDKGILVENEPVRYINKKDGHLMKMGHVSREGVVCDCCNEIFTLSNFEAHAGSKLHRPNANIFLDDGRCISDCQLQACAIQDTKEPEVIPDIGDDACGVCGDGGELILCDHCPSMFHPGCVGLEIIPEGDWYCHRCSCGVCGVSRPEGAMHQCSQCERNFHLTCVQITQVPEPCSHESWFCGSRCEEIYRGLRGLVGASNPLGNGFSWMLLRSTNCHGITPTNLEVLAEHNVKLSVAHNVMQECFLPMVDPRTNINLLSHVLYNRSCKVTRLNYCGFYTMLLEKGDEILTVATIRVHGTRLAELPLVGTRNRYRRQGMCRRLIQALEKMLQNLGVEKLVLPAVPKLLNTWVGSFGFQPLCLSEAHELGKLNLMTFPGTTLLQKLLTSDADSFEVVQSKKSVSPPIEKTRDVTIVKYQSMEGGTFGNNEAQLDNGALCYRASEKFHLDAKVHEDGSLESSQTDNQDISKVFPEMNSGFQLESSYGGPVIRKGKKEDDAYNSKVVITTTRSKRLVRSSRWVADGLKELLKDTSHLKCAPNMEKDLEKQFCDSVHEDLRENILLEKFGQIGSLASSQFIKNVYVRTKKKAGLPAAKINCDVVSSCRLFSCSEFPNTRKELEDNNDESAFSQIESGTGDSDSIIDEGNGDSVVGHNKSTAGTLEQQNVDSLPMAKSEKTTTQMMSTRVYSRRGKSTTSSGADPGIDQKAKLMVSDVIFGVPFAFTWSDHLFSCNASAT